VALTLKLYTGLTRNHRSFLGFLGALFFWLSPPSNGAPEAESPNVACRRNLSLLWEALQHYRANHGSYPHKLSDLLGSHLSHSSVFACPTTRESGDGSLGTDLLDPSNYDPIVRGYGWEFSPDTTIGDGGAKEYLGQEGNLTMLQFKELQEKTPIGNHIPLIRCRHHEKCLNLSVSGKIYESGRYWESNFVKDFPATYTTALNVLLDHRPLKDRFPKRPPNISPELLNFRPWANAMFTDPWNSNHIDDRLTDFPDACTDNIFVHKGIHFDVGAMLQLHNHETEPWFPSSITGVNVTRKFRNAHILGAVYFGHTDSSRVAKITFHRHYKNFPLDTMEWIYGKNVLSHRYKSTDTPEDGPITSSVAWEGASKLGKKNGEHARIFHMTWENPHPEIPVETLDFEATHEDSMPFILAITLEE